MRKISFFLLLITESFFGSFLFAQEYNLLADISLKSELTWLDDGFKDSTAQGQLELLLLHSLSMGNTEFFADQIIIADTNQIKEGNTKLNHTLLSAAVKWNPLDSLEITMGKQRLDWGNGLFFHPSDSFQNYEISIGERMEGFRGISLSWIPDYRFTTTGALCLDDVFDPSPDRIENPFYENISAAIHSSIMTGKLETIFSMVFIPEESIRPGISLSLDLLGFIATTEAAYEFKTEDITGKAGLQRSFYLGDISLSAAAEYLYDAQNIESQRHYAAGVLSLDDGYSWSIATSGYANLKDFGFLLEASIQYILENGMEFNLSGSSLFGDETDEFCQAGKARTLSAEIILHY